MSFDLRDYEVQGMPEEEPTGYISVPEVLRGYIHQHLKSSNLYILDDHSNMSGAHSFMGLPDGISDRHKEQYCNFGEYLIPIIDYPGNSDSHTEVELLKKLLDACKIPYFMELRFSDNLIIYYSAYINADMKYPVRYDSTLILFDPRSAAKSTVDRTSWADQAVRAMSPDWDFIYKHMLSLMPPVILADSIEPLLYREPNS